MNPSRTLPQAAHLVFTALRKSLLLAALFPLLAVAQPVDIVNEGFRAGPSLPVGHKPVLPSKPVVAATCSSRGIPAY